MQLHHNIQYSNLLLNEKHWPITDAEFDWFLSHLDQITRWSDAKRRAKAQNHVIFLSMLTGSH